MDIKTDSIWTMYGDCLERMKEIPDTSIDCIITDPPYGVLNKSNCNWDSIIDLEKMWSELYRIIKPNGNIILFSSQPFTSQLIMSNLKNYKYTSTWIKNKKTGFLNAKKQPLRQTEDINIFYNKSSLYNPQKTSGHKPVNAYTKHTDSKCYGDTKLGITGGGSTERYPSNVLYFDVVNNDSKEKIHNTQKPVDLLEYLIKTYSNENDTVLDFTSGSFSTGVACVNTNRKFIGIEKDENYYKIGTERLMKHSKQLNLNKIF